MSNDNCDEVVICLSNCTGSKKGILSLTWF